MMRFDGKVRAGTCVSCTDERTVSKAGILALPTHAKTHYLPEAEFKVTLQGTGFGSIFRVQQ